MLNELSKQIRFDNASKGFDPTEGGVNRYLLLTISEVCEAQDELRDGKDIKEIYYFYQGVTYPLHDKKLMEASGVGAKNLKPCGFPVELADAVIRLLDIAGKFNFDLESGEAQAEDYEDKPIDDWLLGVCNSVSMAGMYEPNEPDFRFYIMQSLGTLFLLCDNLEIPVMDVVREKLEFNRSRPPKHGRQF